MPHRIIPFRELDANVGTYLGASGWHEIGQEQTNQFAAITGDNEWIHVDVDRATRQLGGTIIHGYHLVSLVPFLMKQILKVEGVLHGLNYGLDRLRFTEQVSCGAQVRLHQTLSAVTPRAGGSLVRIGTRVELKDKERPAMVADCLFLYFPDEAVSGRVDATPLHV